MSESKIQVTYEKVLSFRAEASTYLQFHPGQHRPFTYALSKMLARVKQHEDDFVDKEREINIEHCAKDSKGFAEMEKIPVERRGEKTEQERMKFTVEQQRIANKKKRDLLGTKVDIEPYLADKDVPEDVGFDKWNAFAPFVLPEEPSEEQLDALFAATKRREEEMKAKQEKMLK